MRFLKNQLPPVMWVILIYFLSATPTTRLIAQAPPGVEKLVHAFLYFILCCLMWRAFFFQNSFPIMRNGAYLGAFFFCAIFGILDEYHHNFMTGREADIFNVVANVGGALLFVSIASMKRRKEGN